jgi:hypothetical protein
VSRLNASEKDLDLSVSKESIDEFFQESDWFIKNNGDSYLSLLDSMEDTASGSTNKQLNFGNNLISFDNLVDESYVSSGRIDIL